MNTGFNVQSSGAGAAAWAAYLQLLRLPNLFTAMADVAMGFLFVRASWAWDPPPINLRPIGAWVLAVLAVASALLYAAGVVLNDVFDLERDRRERPQRPLPSGRVSLRAARWIGWESLLAGTALPCGVALLLYRHRPAAAADALVALRPAIVAGALALTIVLYDALLKPTVAGPLALGACRMLNVLLGMSVLRTPLASEHWLIAAAIGVYAAGITWFARREHGRSARAQLAAATAVMMAGVGLLAWLPRWTDNILRAIQQEPGWWYLLVGVLGAITCRRCLWAVASPVPGRVRTAVAQAILSLIFLDAAACYAGCGPFWALLILCLLVPAGLLGRWIEST
ncbi:MAG: UbiA family prenyltransferase [Thermoguttaceae bacterium]